MQPLVAHLPDRTGFSADCPNRLMILIAPAEQRPVVMHLKPGHAALD
jgi:hypothetical protein